MSQIVFLPGFDGDATLRHEFTDALAKHNEVRGVSYPNRRMGSLDAYRDHAMAVPPVDWKPALVAESFSGLVAARWAATDSRVRALVLCCSFARNPVGHAAHVGASMPALVKMGPAFMGPLTWAMAEPRRNKWGAGLSRAMHALDDDVVAERLRLIAHEDVTQALRALTIPVILVHFNGDLVVDASAREQLEAACNRPRVVKVDGPHFALATRPAECAEAINASLA